MMPQRVADRNTLILNSQFNIVDAQQIAEKVRDLIVGSIREEFREFKAEVRGQLEGYRVAIETMNKRMDSLETNVNKRLDGIERRLSNLEMRVDELNRRVNDLNRRIDNVVNELSEIKANLRELKTRDEIIRDIVRRIQKLEERVFA